MTQVHTEIAKQLMAHAKANYNNPNEDWSAMVECQSVAEIAADLERDGVDTFAAAFAVELQVAKILADRRAEANYKIKAGA